MDASEYQECCHSDLQYGDNKDQGQELKSQPFCCHDSQVQKYKSPITTENLNGDCHGNCCAPTDTTPDTRQAVAYNDAKSPDNIQRTQNNHLSLMTLPPELILVIFSYLDARFTLRVLTCVCRLFHNLLSPESSWKTRFGKTWPQRDKREDFDYVSRFVSTIIVKHPIILPALFNSTVISGSQTPNYLLFILYIFSFL